MKKTDRSPPSFLRKFFYGFFVTSLAAIVIALAFAPRTSEIVVARTTLSCSGSRLEPAKLWNALVTADLIVEAANEAGLFHSSVPAERRGSYLKSNFRMQTRPGDTSNKSFAMLNIQHPHRERAKQFLLLLTDAIFATASEVELPQSFAHLPDASKTVYVVRRSTGSLADGRASVRRASLVLFAPNQQTFDANIDDGQPDFDVKTALEEARQELRVTRRRYRALVDATGRTSMVAQNMSYEVERLEGIVQSLENTSKSNRAFEPAVLEPESGTPFQFASAQSGSSSADETSASSNELTFEIVQPAQIVKLIPRGISRDSLFSILPFAGSLGVLAGWCVTRKRPFRILANRHDVERAIDIPILGSVFPTRKKVVAKKSNLANILGQSMVRMGEIGLFLFVGFVLFCAVTDRSFAQNFLRNPFGTLAASVDHYVASNRAESGNPAEASPEASTEGPAGEPLATMPR